jgi:micrococcal nuclease
MKIATLALISMLGLSTTLAAAPVIAVGDGDTLTILRNNKEERIRLSNIDAPEKKQPFGGRSKWSLSALCYGKDATLSNASKDRYGRTLALVQCDGVDVNREQVRRGMAWVYPKYNQDATLPAIESDAKQARRGLWANDDPTPPWRFRHRNKN